jgi:hypothetical protein
LSEKIGKPVIEFFFERAKGICKRLKDMLAARMKRGSTSLPFRPRRGLKANCQTVYPVMAGRVNAG